MTAQGNMRLLQSDLYPFTLDVAFTNLQFVEIDLVTALANGQVHIEGNQTSALAKGDVDILSSTLTIPDHIPRPLPNLQVVYVNATKPIPVATPSYQPYPLYLDLNIRTFEHISIEGRGLQSQWLGNFHLGGTFTEPAAQGALELIEGTFSFSSRDFRLTQGSLSLSGLEHEMPYLNLAGTTETGGITITAQLTGPLNNPQIKLQSTPPLPLSSIMSHLLFGQDISEISGFQALQLASSIASLAGTGPDIMESTRRSLGVDRLRIITDPTEEGGETVALQVGKYVSKGVLVTFTQGASESAPNISVEVEIKGNIVLQIQSDQSQEQGIFTLKWNLNY
jgi:translocation and assembly module TamB